MSHVSYYPSAKSIREIFGGWRPILLDKSACQPMLYLDRHSRLLTFPRTTRMLINGYTTKACCFGELLGTE